MKRPDPKCPDCGETDRLKFYAHPTNPSRCQKRCKVCDNINRVERTQVGQEHIVSVITTIDGPVLHIDGQRVAGPKSWDDGIKRHEFKVSGHALRVAMGRGLREKRKEAR